jgi:hypothetical protein
VYRPVKSSQEQTSRIEQINQAITQMDQATQQNASLVEEAAAAAESMQEQAVNLAQVVSVFKLAGTPVDGTHVRGATVPTATGVRTPVKTGVVKLVKKTPEGKVLPAPAARNKRIAAAAADDEWEQF